jgi:hypothetical protein
MKDQWFLDLDGVKSGPYQTNEVLNLISDGEVLPHHLISTALKAKEWKTILDWKLGLSSSTSSSATSVAAPVAKSEPVPAAPITPPQKPASTIAEPSIVTDKQASANPETDQDAMAEMFDTIHHTKLKREQKSQQEQAASQPILEPETQITSSTGKFILVSIVITALGFTLGQLFQKQNTGNPVASSTPTTSSVSTSGAPTSPAAPSSELQILDRSNDRITIRSQAPMNSPPPPPAAAMRPEYAPQERSAEAPREPEKDTQMMEELKKELSELKALKEEIRNNEYSDELPDNNAQSGMTGPTPGNPEPNPDMNPDQNPGANPGENPAAPTDEAHY